MNTACEQLRGTSKPLRLAALLLSLLGGLARQAAAQPAQGGTGADAPYLGVIIPNSSVELASRFEGRLESLEARVGDAVRAGQVLARLDARPLQQELAGARASLEGARAEERAAAVGLAEAREKQQRYESPRLVKLGVFSREELDTVRFQAQAAAARVEVARAQAREREVHVSQLQQSLADTALVAPFDGAVAATPVSAGARLAAGQPVVRIQGNGRRKVRFAVPEEQARKLQVGALAKVALSPGDAALAGRVESVAPEVDAAARMVFAIAAFEDEPPDTASTGQVVQVRTAPRPSAAERGPADAVPTRSGP